MKHPKIKRNQTVTLNFGERKGTAKVTYIYPNGTFNARLYRKGNAKLVDHITGRKDRVADDGFVSLLECDSSYLRK